MKIHIFSFVLWVCCLLSVAHSACDLTGKKQDKAFPDITKDVAESYIMGVEYSVGGAKQTDYYTEYYDTLFKRGRLESHISGQNQTYIYQYETWEAWTIQSKTCTLQNITEVPDFLKDFQSNWLRYSGSPRPDAIGPSAMFKIALDAWSNKKDTDMAYMGDFDGEVRGEKAEYWRRCLPSGGYADYIFAASSVQNPFDTGSSETLTPLRVVFNDISTNDALKKQVHDIISFQHYIPKGVEPFQLPKGRNCDRSDLVDGPVLPDFSANSLLLSAEVIYQKFDKEGEDLSTYYSTLTLVLDKESNHLAYYFAPWNVTKFQKKTGDDSLMDSPQYVIYDMKHMYEYVINYDTAKCQIIRDKSFVPQYKLPEDAGYLALTDPYILFPFKNLKFLSEGKNRGLDVNIFEAEIESYLLDKDTVIPRAIATHSYLKSNEELENTVSVKYAPTQIQLRLFRNDEEEVLTLNIFGFTTRIPQRRRYFDVRRCFKNDDDSLVLTIGYEIENQYLQQVEKALPAIERNTVGEITTHSELNAVRMPYIMTDFKDNYVYVTIVVLGKPPLQLDYNEEKGRKIKTSSTDDAQGVSTFDICANNCLEEKNNCWGFSMCGATCYYGSEKATEVEVDDKCTLYRRFNNDTFMFSKEKLVNGLVAVIQDGEFNIVAPIGDKMITLTATSADISDPAEDDSVFEKMGNRLNPRMRVLKVSKKLKKGSNIKNLGKLRYDECQSVCLDFKNCETLSYCLKNSECILGNKYDSDLTDGDMELNDMCVLLARKYTDHFDRTPGVFVESVVGTKKDLNNLEDCARACLKEDSFKCLSFDHCGQGTQKGCSLYTMHYLSPADRKASVKGKNPTCGHYTRKYSTEFKRKAETRVVGSKVPPITNLTLEQCAKSCIEYGEGTCFGYDFCQDKTLYATSCTLFDTDPSRLQTAHNSMCTNYIRTEAEYAPHPYTNSYAGGIGFLCFLVGAIIGAVVVFAIAYIRANRG